MPVTPLDDPQSAPFLAKLRKSWPLEAWRDFPVVAAVSGGADSVAMLRGLVTLADHNRPSDVPNRLRTGTEEIAPRFIVAHYNHGLRDSADKDERFVRELCTVVGEAVGAQLTYAVGRPDIPIIAATSGQGVEATARNARYDFLLATAKQHGARYIATAHTADDQAETILHRILRGTGVGGAAGIRPVRKLGPDVTLVRPLLEIRRQEVEEYLNVLGQSYRDDPTNLDFAFTRNRIRHDLLPRLAADYNCHVVEALVRFGELCEQAQSVVDVEVAELYEESVEAAAEGGVAICSSKLADRSGFLISELLISVWKRQGWPLQDMSREKWTLLTCLLQAGGSTDPPPTPQTLPGEIRAFRDDDRLVLRPI